MKIEQVLSPEPTKTSITMMPLGKIKSAPWNPPGRVEERRLWRLAESIDDIGLVYPIVLNETMRIVDGHKRRAVAEGMRWKAIPAIVISSELEHAYGSLNANQERMTGNDLIGIYLENPLALIQRQKRKIQRVEMVCGRAVLTMLYKAGLSVGLFDLAVRTCRYADSELEVTPVLRWLARHGAGKVIRHVIDSGTPKGVIVRAVREDKPLKIKVTAE